ncbi:MAG: 4'-phosphopantetheinyl transferase superfamily protein, partial [Candidatus Altiarchaeota archaeon]|nr:4'-phosphopantetheinyl transferase superfamily protein [Candidatus Altiarchaeota archaeon]
MILGIGVDIESIESFKKVCSNENFIRLVFSKREVDYCRGKTNPTLHFAGKFTAKEAVIKAFPTPL